MTDFDRTGSYYRVILYHINNWIAFDVRCSKTHEHKFYEYFKYFCSEEDFENHKFNEAMVDNDGICHFDNNLKVDSKCPIV